MWDSYQVCFDCVLLVDQVILMEQQVSNEAEECAQAEPKGLWPLSIAKCLLIELKVGSILSQIVWSAALE